MIFCTIYEDSSRKKNFFIGKKVKNRLISFSVLSISVTPIFKEEFREGNQNP
jgi:hypothetical protein